MNCKQCKKEVDKFNYVSVRRYEEIDGEDVLQESHDFCSAECSIIFWRALDDQIRPNFEYYEIARCPAYYYCKENQNLRGGCETKEIIGDDGRNGMLHLIRQPICNPAEAGIIIATARFNEESTKLNKEMLKHTKSMSALTTFILLFTWVNLGKFDYAYYSN